MSTDLQEPVRLPDGRIQISAERTEDLLRAPINLARAEAEAMISKGVSSDIAFRHLEAAYQKSYETRAKLAAGMASQQPATPQPAATPTPTTSPAPTQAPSQQPAPLATPGTPPAHQSAIEALARLSPLMAAQAMHRQEQEAAIRSGAGMTNMAVPFGLGRRRP